MLKQLQVVNYQSHENTILNFHRGVNCIIGDSQAGKTAVLRSIHLLSKNRPSRFTFHSDFAKTGITSVKTITSKDEEIKIIKSKKKTKYTLIADEKREWWRKLNRTVPDRVTDVLNLTDLNIQWQFDNPFLISTSGGEIARVINEKTKIDEADSWIKTLNKKITILKHKKSSEEVEIENNLAELKGLSDLPKLNRLLNRLTTIDRRVDKFDKEYIQIDSILANIEDTENKIKEQRKYLKAERYVVKIEAIDKEIETLLKEKELIDKVNQCKIDISLATKYKNKYIDRYVKLLKKVKKCPTCFSPVGTKDIKRITDEISITF